MKTELSESIKIKIAIALNLLMESSKKFQHKLHVRGEIINSYNEIALEAGIRKATVSDTFNAKSRTGPNSITVILIVKALGYNLQDFAKKYDMISDNDVENFKKS